MTTRRWMIVVAVIALLTTASLSIAGARESVRRAECVNYFKVVGLWLENFQSAYGGFPPATVGDPAAAFDLSADSLVTRSSFPEIESCARHTSRGVLVRINRSHYRGLVRTVPAFVVQVDVNGHARRIRLSRVLLLLSFSSTSMHAQRPGTVGRCCARLASLRITPTKCIPPDLPNPQILDGDHRSYIKP
jgi:hypothetical protein